MPLWSPGLFSLGVFPVWAVYILLLRWDWWLWERWKSGLALALAGCEVVPRVVPAGPVERRVAFLWSWPCDPGARGCSWPTGWVPVWLSSGKPGACAGQQVGRAGMPALTDQRKDSRKICSHSTGTGVEQIPQNSWPRLLSSCYLPVETQNVCHLTCDSRAESYSCTSPVLLNRSSPSFSKLYILGACLVSSGSPGWGAPFGPPTPHSLEGTSVLGISLPFVVCQHRGMGLHLSYPSCVVPSFCLQLWKIFSASVQEGHSHR